MTQFRKAYDLIDTSQLTDKMTIIEHLMDHVDLYTLGRSADISVETYSYDRIIFVIQGCIEVVERNKDGIVNTWKVQEGETFLMEKDKALGATALKDSVVMRRCVVNSSDLHPLLTGGKAVNYGQLAPYIQNQAVRTDLLSNDVMSLYILALDAHTYSQQLSHDQIIFMSLLNDQACSLMMENDQEKIAYGTYYELTESDSYTVHSHEKPVRIIVMAKKKS